MARPIVKHIINGLQICRRCKNNLPIDQFHANKAKLTGISQYCKECALANNRDNYHRNKDGKLKFKVGSYKKGTKEYIDHKRNWKLQYSYGMTLTEYNNLFSIQKGACAICNIHQSELAKPLHVDHDHKTGEVRGLLCHKCNTGLGLLNDDITILQNTIVYLQKYLENYQKKLALIKLN